MFSSLISNKKDDLHSSSHLGGGGKNKNHLDIHQARKEARGICKAQHNAVKPLQDTVMNCRQSQYWNYGYRLGACVFFFAGSMIVAHKIPAVGHFGAVPALFGGWVVGSFAHQTHISFLSAKLINQIDSSVKVLETKDATSGSNIGVPEYREAMDVLNKLRISEVNDRASAGVFGMGIGGSGPENNVLDEHGNVISDQQKQQQHADPLDREVARIMGDFERRKAKRIELSGNK